MLRQALDQYIELHGKKPHSIVVTPHAALAIAAKGTKLTSSFQEVPIVCTSIDGNDAVPEGTGSRLGLFVRDNGIQQHVAAVELR